MGHGGANNKSHNAPSWETLSHIHSRPIPGYPNIGGLDVARNVIHTQRKGNQDTTQQFKLCI